MKLNRAGKSVTEQRTCLVGLDYSQSSENEQVIAVAVKVNTYTRSKSLIPYLHKNGHSVNYSRLLRIEARLENSIVE
jgi:hypothetical protein